MFNGEKLSILEDEEALEMDGGDGCLMLLKCTLKNR